MPDKYSELSKASQHSTSRLLLNNLTTRERSFVWIKRTQSGTNCFNRIRKSRLNVVSIDKFERIMETKTSIISKFSNMMMFSHTQQNQSRQLKKLFAVKYWPIRRSNLLLLQKWKIDLMTWSFQSNYTTTCIAEPVCYLKEGLMLQVRF